MFCQHLNLKINYERYEKVSPIRYKLLQDIENTQMDIENMQIGYNLLLASERKEINKQLEHLYQIRANLKRQLRNEPNAS